MLPHWSHASIPITLFAALAILQSPNPAQVFGGILKIFSGAREVFVDFAQIASALLAFAALLITWSDRMSRERPQLVFRRTRGEKDDPAVTNTGFGPAYQIALRTVKLGLSTHHFGKEWKVERKDLISSFDADVLLPGESFSAQRVVGSLMLELVGILSIVAPDERVDVLLRWEVDLSYRDRSQSVSYSNSAVVVARVVALKRQVGKDTFQTELDEVEIWGATHLSSSKVVRWGERFRRIFS